ncbi:MAG: LytR C-terminal domain-containing protein [Bacteroidota bacterium]
MKNIWLENSTSDTKPEEKVIQLDGTISIYNSTNVYGLAKEMKLFLNSFEINKISTQNYDKPLNKSVLISKPGSIQFANYVAKLIDYLPDSIKTDENQKFDLVIILGSDFKLLKPFKN